MATVDDDFIMVDSTHVQGHPDHLTSISAYIDQVKCQLRTAISLPIHDNPELQYKEYLAHHILTDFMKQQQGWKVTPSAYEIDTAFVAVYDGSRKGPTVSFNAEYGKKQVGTIILGLCSNTGKDALVGIGHACGHNLIAVTSVAGALATAHMIDREKLSGKVVLFGTPAEGAYKDHNVDISLISHSGISPDAALVRTAAYSAMEVEYFGKEAHAAARPWDGIRHLHTINALDALITAYNAISVLRQQTESGDIIQGSHVPDSLHRKLCLTRVKGMIANGGARPNIIHAYSSGKFVVRSSSRARLEALKKRVYACFEAGALATGATLKLTPGGSYNDHMPNRTLAKSYRANFNRLGGTIPREDIDIISSATMASTDQGNISYAIPSISPNCWIRSEDETGKQLGGPHTPDFEKAARTEEAHELAMRVAKGLAATAVDILTTPTFLEEVRREFADMKRSHDFAMDAVVV
ncbi:Hypothetical protein R9X50_00117700 [Acrodontium crateriforme]|uniref:Peptidase M20 domain-containing protein 2 n=1 Tax=Acrodontium crateriforme TaxID=150365 RepID=A0AAQ3M1K4_9PEZI|nr:Hypothetical protein R9X50_00117700 [Acrodontium crateriforme]